MPEIVTTCTQCQRQLRVPEELQGRMVKCPACQFTFTIAPAESPQLSREATYPGETARLPEELSQGQRLPAPPQEAAWEAEERTRAAVRMPAIALVVVGVLGLLGCSLSMANVVVNEAMFREQLLQMFKILAPGEAAPPVDGYVLLAKVMYGGFGLVSLVVVLGAIQMMRLKTYWLAATAAVLAMFNPVCGCCLLGLPVSIWALIVLFRPGVSGVFQS